MTKLVLGAEWGRDEVPKEGTEGQPGWKLQGIPWEKYRDEIVAADAELRKDGAFAVLYTVGAYATPNNPPDFDAFNLDDQADEISGFGLTNTGPHVHRVLNQGVRRWIMGAPVVKALDDPYPLSIARDDAVRIFRATLDHGPHAMTATEAANILLGRLQGYRHPKLYAELWVGVPPADASSHAAKLRAVAVVLKQNGVMVCGPGWYTGNGEPAQVAPFAFVDAYASQGYWGNLGPTVHHALRYRTLFPRATPAPPPKPAPAPKPPVPPSKPALPDVCPFAAYKPLERNFDREGVAPRIVVWHGTAGLGDPYNWWNRSVPSNQAASADFWISKLGVLKQYVKLVSETSWSNGPLVKPDLSVPFLKWLVEYRKTHAGFSGNWWTISVELEKDKENADPLTAAQVKTGNKLARWLAAEFEIPLDRTHHLGHYQFDGVSRSRCPSLRDAEWSRLLEPAGKPEPKIDALRDQLWALKDTAWALGRQRLGDDVVAAVRRDKGEIP